ncbi:MAG: Crp/Fnr family transcriptional regulator [Hyphomonadaceae bacterium]
MAAQRVLVREGAPSPYMFVVREGWVLKFDLLPNGGRQIIDILLPGDSSSYEELFQSQAPSTLFTLTDAEICQFEREEILDICKDTPTDIRRYGPILGDNYSRLRMLLGAVGRQKAEARVASLILMLHERLRKVKYATETDMPFPLRQRDVANLLGMTQVHVSRVMAAMQKRGVIRKRAAQLTIENFSELIELAES